jgi:hypothetical protein
VKFLAIWRRLASVDSFASRATTNDLFLPRSSRVKIYCESVADSACAHAPVKTFEKLISPICFLRTRAQLANAADLVVQVARLNLPSKAAPHSTIFEDRGNVIQRGTLSGNFAP